VKRTGSSVFQQEYKDMQLFAGRSVQADKQESTCVYACVCMQDAAKHHLLSNL
jgi:hypothetical protein